MALNTQYTKIENLRQDLIYNMQEGEEYRPLTIRTQGTVLTAEGARRELETMLTVGNLNPLPLTIKQIYTQLGNVSNMHTRLQNALKAFYISALNEDVSL